ncbi:glycosyltransferase family 4 protein [Nostoc sp. NIES-2111]
MRICIVTSGQLGSNPRVVKEANALQAAGHHVHVISTRTLQAVDPRDQDVLASATWRSLRLDFRSRAHWKRLRLGQVAARVLPLDADGLLYRQLSAFTPPLVRAASNNPADLYIAHYPPALPAAAVAASRNGARYAYDAEDFHTGELRAEDGLSREVELIHRTESRLLTGAAYVTAASPMIADAYHEVYRVPRPTVILNVFPKVPSLSYASAGSAMPGPSLYWFSQTLGPQRGLECAVKALSMMRTPVHLHLRGSASDGFRNYLFALAESGGCVGRLHILDHVAPSLLESDGARFDIGLVSETGETLNRRIALTNKLFSYCVGGVPCVASDIPAHCALAAEFGDALTLFKTGDPASLAAAVDRLLERPGKLAAARARAWELGQSRYNWDVEQERLVSTVEFAMAATHPRAA